MLTLLACAPPELPETVRPDGGEPEIPALEPVEHVAVWTPEEAVAALQGALELGFPSPFTVRASLARAFDHGDADCPGLGTLMAGPSFEGCTSGEGWYYLGVGGYTEDVLEDDAGAYVELSVRGDLTVIDPSGAELDVGGHWLIDLHEGPIWSGILNGSWWEPASEDAWLATGTSAWLDYAGTGVAGAEHVSLDGAITTGAFGDDPVTVAFEGVEWGEGSCGDVPTGVLSVWDPGGGTWRFDFDPADGASCAPCGAVSFDGTSVATDTCLDGAGFVANVVLASSP